MELDQISAIDLKESLRTIKRMMEFIGTWPHKSPPITYKFRRFLSMLLLSSFIAFTLIRIFSHFRETANLSYGLSMSTAALQSFLRHMVLFPQVTNFYDILNNINHPLFTTKSKKSEMFIKKKIRVCNFLRTVLLGSSLMTVAMVGAAPFLTIRSERSLPVPFPFEMNDKPLILYICIWCFQTSAVGMIAWSLPCLDSLIFTLMWTAVAQLEILKENLTDATKVISMQIQNFYSDDWQKEMRDFLKKCVDHHIAIEKYVVSIENTFTTAFLIQLVANLIITCLIGFNFILIPVMSMHFGRCLFFFVAVMMEFALFCIPGNELIYQSQRIQDACYSMDWDFCRPVLRKTLFLMMERAKRPYTITARKFVVLSLESLLAVWKSAFSYFTVLWHLYSNSEIHTHHQLHAA